MRRFILLVFILTGLLSSHHPTVGQVVPRRQLALSDAITQATAQSKATKTNAAEQGAANAKVQQARHTIAPAITLNASYIRISDNITPFRLALPGAGDVILNPQILNQSYNNVQVRQLIWGGGKVRYGIRAAEAEAEATRQEATQYQLDAADNATSIWYNLYLLDASERILQQNVRLLQDRRTDLENLEKQGLVLKNDALKISLAIANLENGLIDVRSGRAIQNFNMATALSEPLDTEYVVDSTALTATTDPEPLTSYLTEAVQNRSELKALSLRRDAALLGQKIVQSNRLPTLALGGSYDYNRPNMRVFPLEPAFKGTWNVGLFLSFDITGQYGNRAKEVESQYNLDKIGTGIDQLRDGIRMEVNAQYQSYRQAIDKIRVARQAIGQATENVRVEQNRLNASTATPTDFLDANTQLIQARLNEQTAQANAELARWKLLKSVGRVN